MKTDSTVLRVSVLAALAGVFTLLVSWDSGGLPMAHAQHLHPTSGERGGGGLPGGQNDWFTGSGLCEGCHGHDFAGHAMLDSDSVDVNVVDHWRSSMMANAAHDPFWRAKVSHEVLVNPAHQVQLEDKCTRCHAPQGRFNSDLNDLGPYSIASMTADPIALDGVSCLVCHRQSADSIGLLFSGNLKFETSHTVYGPYWDNIFGAPMTAFVGYTPEYGAHINSAGLCAGCHTLITETADLSGNSTGDEFVEQATYHEWLNSAFNNEADSINGITCQGCHVPRIDDPVVLSANYLFLLGRSPFGKHELAGGNSFMLTMLRDHIAQLDLTATETQFDSTIARTLRNLQDHSLLLDVSVAARDADTAMIDVRVENLTGHKFPSGYPSRRAWIQLAVTDVLTGDTLFMSGAIDPQYEVVGHPADFEPHYDVISDGMNAQIYEMVMGDVNDDKTTVLERAKTKLKDNRLPPLGFTTAHITYDTAYIAGVPTSDIDFNHDGLGTEGSASDITHYHVPMSGFTSDIAITARVWYQSVPPLWNQEMFAYSSAAIDSFKIMYEAADNSPVLVEEKSITDISFGVDDLAELGAQVFPNPVSDGWVNVIGISARVSTIELYDVQGRLIARNDEPKHPTWRVRIPDGAGSYLLVFRSGSRTFTQLVVAR